MFIYCLILQEYNVPSFRNISVEISKSDGKVKSWRNLTTMITCFRVWFWCMLLLITRMTSNSQTQWNTIQASFSWLRWEFFRPFFWFLLRLKDLSHHIDHEQPPFFLSTKWCLSLRRERERAWDQGWFFLSRCLFFLSLIVPVIST